MSLYALDEWGEDYAASNDYKIGQKVAVTNLANGRVVVVKILDRGPKKSLNRIIDLSEAAFSQIADLEQGLIKVTVEAL